MKPWLARFRWRRWLTAGVALLAAYTALGFVLVPALIRHQLPRLGQSELARKLSVGDVTFNPFTLRLVVDGLRLDEADGAPLFAVGKLDAEFQWRSLARRAWSFAGIRITAPSANLVIDKDGRFNVAALLATLDARPRQPAAETGLPRLVVEQFVLEQGKVDVRDLQAGYANAFAPIEFRLAGFSTLPDRSEAHTFTAKMARGGTLRWTGTSSVNPIQGRGELVLDDVSLAEPSVYLKPFVRAGVSAGKLSASLPYRFAYADGRLDARLAGARLSLQDLAVTRDGAKDAFASLARLQVSDVDADLVQRQAVVGEVRVEGGHLAVLRNAKGEIDLADLAVPRADAAGAPSPAAPAEPGSWKLAIRQVALDGLAVRAVDETAVPPLIADAGKLRLQFQLDAEQAGPRLQLKLAGVSLSLADLALASGARTPFRLGALAVTDGAFDLAERRASIGRLHAQAGHLQLTRNPAGELDLPGLLAKPGPASPAAARPPAAGKPWAVAAGSVELSQFSAALEDQGSGVKLHVDDLGVKVAGASSDLAKPVKFEAGLTVREGGRLSAHGSVVPAGAAVRAQVQVRQLALAPMQPLLARHVRLKLAGGHVSAQGLLTTGAGTTANPRARYVGALNVAGLALNEDDGEPFASWRDVGADKLTASIGPNLLDIPELRVVQADAKLIIENDRSFNAARLLVQQPAAAGSNGRAAPPAATQDAADDPFPVRVRRVRLDNAKLDFTDLSLRPQFGAKIHELSGVVTGLTSSKSGRSQVELDGRVDEFGLARIRGELNPFALRNNTDLSVVFRNVDMVTASPYTMKFAGYRIAEGRISLDLQYKVRNSQLEGANQVVIDRLTLGEKVDSPDAFNLPLELAIALLKDSDGRIDLGLPVSGNLDDPQFSYGALVWKVIGNVLTKIVTAPFRAIGALLGVGGEKLESIDFDPGSARLLPPEREKIRQIAQLLAKRPQLKLSVPGTYSESADGASLRTRAVRVEIARRTGARLDAGEEPGPVDYASRAVRGALRDLYAARFGEAAFDEQRKSAEAVAAKGGPQAADALYRQLHQRLDKEQPLAADALARLGAERAEAIVAGLREAGIDAARAVATAPEKGDSPPSQPVPLKLVLTAK